MFTQGDVVLRVFVGFTSFLVSVIKSSIDGIIGIQKLMTY